MKLHFPPVHTLKVVREQEGLHPAVGEINGKTHFDLRRRWGKLDKVKPGTNGGNTHTSGTENERS